MPRYPRTRIKILFLFLVSWATFVLSKKEEKGDLNLKFVTKRDGSIICDFYGSKQHPVTEEELQTFELDDTRCPSKLIHYFEETEPDACFFGHGKHEGDTNRTFFENGWITPFSIYHVENATLIGRERKELLAYHDYWTNFYGLRTYVKVFQKRAYENSIAHLNRSGNKFGIGASVKVSVPGFGDGGSEMKYEHEWGSEQTESTKHVLEIGGEVFVTVDPHTIAAINITAWQEVWTFQVTYAINLGGHVIANFAHKFYDSHIWNINLNAISGGPRYYTEMVRLNRIENSNTAIGAGE